MIIALDPKNFKVLTGEINKHIGNTEDMLKNCKLFNSSLEAVKEGYLPITLGVSIRTLFTNKVVEFERDCYVKMVSDVFNKHQDLDLYTLISKIGETTFDCFKRGFNVGMFMIEYSFLDVIGMYHEGGSDEVIFLAHVLIADEGLPELEKNLKEGIRVVNIGDMSYANDNPALLETLVEVKDNECSEGI